MTHPVPLDGDTRMRLRRDRVAWRRVGNEVIALELEGDKYLSAGACAAELWERLAEPVTSEELVAWTAEHYGIEIERARSDVSAFLAQLIERGLLESV